MWARRRRRELMIYFCAAIACISRLGLRRPTLSVVYRVPCARSALPSGHCAGRVLEGLRTFASTLLIVHYRMEGWIGGHGLVVCMILYDGCAYLLISFVNLL